MRLRWEELSLFSCLAYVVQVSLLTIQALYMAILVFIVNLGLVHTREVRRANVVATFPNLLIDLSVQGEVASDSGVKNLCELFNDIELVVIDVDGWQFDCILPHDVALYETDGLSKVLAGVTETVHLCLQLLLGVGRHCCLISEQHVSDECFTNLYLGSEAAKIEKPAV